MSKEGLSWENPIRAYSGGISYEKQKNTFEKQAPGTVVEVIEDPTQFNTSQACYRATAYKTSKGQPIWEKLTLDGATGKPMAIPGQYIWVQNGKPGKSDSKFTSITRNGKKIEYEDVLIKNKIVKNRIDNPQKYGNFIFIKLSDFEIESVTPGDTSTGSAATSTTATTNNSIPAPAARTGVDTEFLEELQRANEKWDNFYNRGQKWREVDGFDTGRGPNWRELEGFDPGKGSNGATNPSSNNPRSQTGSKNQNQTGSRTKTVNVIIQTETLSSGIVYSNTVPYMEQLYSVYERPTNAKDGTASAVRRDIVRRHVFDIIPNTFEFSQLNSTWNEVPRSGNYPYVDWSNYNLTKVSFRFLVAGVRDARFGLGFFKGEPLNDGLEVSIDEQIDNLRSMAAAPSPIRIYNMNTLLSNSFRYPFLQKAGGISWVIADMSISANRLTKNAKNMAAAEVSITLNEYPIIARDIIYIPKLKPGKDKPECCPPPTQDPQRDLWTNTYSFVPVVNSVAYPQPKSE